MRDIFEMGYCSVMSAKELKIAQQIIKQIVYMNIDHSKTVFMLSTKHYIKE